MMGEDIWLEDPDFTQEGPVRRKNEAWKGVIEKKSPRTALPQYEKAVGLTKYLYIILAQPAVPRQRVNQSHAARGFQASIREYPQRHWPLADSLESVCAKPWLLDSTASFSP